MPAGCPAHCGAEVEYDFPTGYDGTGSVSVTPVVARVCGDLLPMPHRGRVHPCAGTRIRASGGGTPNRTTPGEGIAGGSPQ